MIANYCLYKDVEELDKVHSAHPHRFCWDPTDIF